MNELSNHLISSWTGVQHEVQQHRVRSVRSRMFEDILRLLREPPDPAAVLFGQDKLLATARLTDDCIQTNNGILLYTMRCDYFGHVSSHSYSLFLTGDIFRIGLLLANGLEQAPLSDWKNELIDMWPGTPPEQHNRQDMTLYEWTFGVPDLYDNYVTRERFVLGMRHMQGRVLRIIRDYFKMLSEGRT